MGSEAAANRNLDDSEDDSDFAENDGGYNFEGIHIPLAPKPVCSFENKGPRLIITHIENENFKSYAGKQTLGPFHSSFNSIIGPNGSGKSNVIDSMLFVFGYRSAKIRSKRVAVLIHRSEKFKNCPSCTVTVHFAEVTDLPGQKFTVHEDTKFCIGRTAFQDNTSFYTLNNRRTKFKEISTLLGNHGIDLDHNRFLILQGEVEQIAMMKPKALDENDMGLLEFLEDIIGTHRFKEPIEQLREKLEELTNLRSEKLESVKQIEAEKEALEAPRLKVLRYLYLENEVAVHTNMLMQKYMRENQQMIDQKEEDKLKFKKLLEEKVKKLKEVNNEEKKFEVAKTALIKELNKFADEKDKLNAQFKKYENEDDGYQAEVVQSSKNKSRAKEQLEEETKKLARYEALPAKYKDDLKALEKREAQLLKKVSEEEEEMNEIRLGIKKGIENLCSQKDELETKLTKFHSVVTATKNQYDMVCSELQLLTLPEKTANEKLKELIQSLKDSQEKLKAQEVEQSELKKKVPVLKNEIIKAKEEREKLMNEGEAIRKEIQGHLKLLEEARSSLHMSKSSSKVAQYLMQCKKQGKVTGFFGRLGDLGAIDKKYDVAVSTACGRLDNIVVDTVQTAQDCIQLMRETTVGKASFIALDRQEHLRNLCSTRIQTPENVPRLFDLIKVDDEKVRVAFYFSLRDTLVAEDMSQALRIAYGKQRYRVVTLQGQIIELAGTISGGGKTVLRGRMGQEVIVSRKSHTAQDVENLERKIRELRDEYGKITERIQELEILIPRKEMELSNINTQLAKIASLLEGLATEIPLMAKQVKVQEKHVSEVTVDADKIAVQQVAVEKARTEYEKATNDAQKISVEVDRINLEIEQKSTGKMSAARKKVDETKKMLEKIRQEIRKSTVGITTAERNAVKSKQKIEDLEAEIERAADFIKDLKEKKKGLEDLAKDVLEKLEKVIANIKIKQDEIDSIDEQVKEVRKQHFEIRSEAQEIENEIDIKERTIVEYKAKIPGIKKRMKALKLNEVPGESWNMKLETLTNEQIDALDVKELQYRLTLIEGNLAQDKPDLAVIDEYLTKEKLYLEKVSELHEASQRRERMRRVYDEVRKVRLAEFLKGYRIITAKLKETYQMLTLGGDAEFDLVDSLDPFTEGINLSVRPPGKSWKCISNLSGGEKTLSSLALIFALHYYKPSPLFVMDEIDAALDFKNVTIVGLYIMERTKNAQFIVISLRANMFELAKRLIGIFKTNDCTRCMVINPETFAAVLDHMLPVVDIKKTEDDDSVKDECETGDEGNALNNRELNCKGRVEVPAGSKRKRIVSENCVAKSLLQDTKKEIKIETEDGFSIMKEGSDCAIENSDTTINGHAKGCKVNGNFTAAEKETSKRKVKRVSRNKTHKCRNSTPKNLKPVHTIDSEDWTDVDSEDVDSEIESSKKRMFEGEFSLESVG